MILDEILLIDRKSESNIRNTYVQQREKNGRKIC